MKIHAVVVVDGRGTRPPFEVALSGSRWVYIGRGAEAGIALPCEGVSRSHARVRVREGHLEVEDLGSRNGTVVVRADQSARTVDPGGVRRLEAGESLRVASWLLLPCEPAGGGALLGEHGLPDLASVTVDMPVDELGRGGTGRVAEALGARCEGDPLDWILDGALALAGGSRAFLFATDGDRLMHRAERGVDRPVVVSDRFLKETSRREKAWTVVRRGGVEPIRLVGIPLVGGRGSVVGIVYVEVDVEEKPDLAELTAFGRAVAPVAALHSAWDRERRRRESLQRRFEREPVKEGSVARDAEGAGLVGTGPLFSEALDTARRAAASDATVILRGPSGSGKDRIARLLHAAGPRREQPFEVLNAAALPETLVEAELFGYEKGAFTGADRSSAGAFERADGGTLFLDEIGDLSPAAQAKILRVIESGEVRRIGGRPRRVDVRLVTATHRDLEKMVEQGSFREDLFYRLRVIEIRLPPLVERPEDVMPLASHFLRVFRRPDGGHVKGFSPGATRLLRGYGWPGNIRELRNVIERAVVLDRDGVIDEDDLSGSLAPSADPLRTAGCTDLLELPWLEARKRFERKYFEVALARNGGRVTDTARQTSVTRRTMTTKIQEHRLKDH